MTIDRRKVLGLLGLSGAAAGEAAAATVKGLHEGPVRFEHGSPTAHREAETAKAHRG